jgi:uncharacterized protein (UPF0332 family)
MNENDEIVANLERAASSLQAARILLAAELFNDAASRAYYAVFHAASALLLAEGLNFSSHTGVLRAISLNFVKPGKLEKRYGRSLNWLAELRQVADYGEIQSVSASDVKNAIAEASQFLTQVHQLLQSQES